VSAIIFTVIFK